MPFPVMRGLWALRLLNAAILFRRRDWRRRAPDGNRGQQTTPIDQKPGHKKNAEPETMGSALRRKEGLKKLPAMGAESW